MGHSITFTVPVRTVSPLNVREHHHVRAQRVGNERLATMTELSRRHTQLLTLPVVVQMTRISPKRNRIKDSDALPGSLKAIRDQVAKTLGVDDADLLLEKPPIIWAPPTQEVGPWGVRVVITSIPSTAPVAAGEPGLDPRVIGLGVTVESLVNLVREARKARSFLWENGDLAAGNGLDTALAPFASLVCPEDKP